MKRADKKLAGCLILRLPANFTFNRGFRFFKFPVDSQLYYVHNTVDCII